MLIVTFFFFLRKLTDLEGSLYRCSLLFDIFIICQKAMGVALVHGMFLIPSSGREDTCMVIMTGWLLCLFVCLFFA